MLNLLTVWEVLRHPPCEDVSWKKRQSHWWMHWIVILLVRMWVEKQEWFDVPCAVNVILLVRMWVENSIRSIPPVSIVVILLVRMWVEKKVRKLWICTTNCHPPCEDVSWKNIKCTSPVPSASSSLWGCELKREWCKNVWYSSIALFMRKIVPSNDMNSIYVMRKRGELKEYKLQFLSIKKGLHY